MKTQERESSKQDVSPQCIFPTFMEMVLDTVERVLRNNAKDK